jgi:hypothetical protein
VNTENGCRYRAYRVGEVTIDMEGHPLHRLAIQELATIILALGVSIDRLEGVSEYATHVERAKKLREKLSAQL